MWVVAQEVAAQEVVAPQDQYMWVAPQEAAAQEVVAHQDQYMWVFYKEVAAQEVAAQEVVAPQDQYMWVVAQEVAAQEVVAPCKLAPWTNLWTVALWMASLCSDPGLVRKMGQATTRLSTIRKLGRRPRARETIG